MAADEVSFIVNGSRQLAPAGAELISVLREHLGLTGAKLGCGEGACGACTVLVDGEPVRSCQLAAESVAGKRITTIEGLGSPARPHPVQRAFAQEGAAQCGYCTPGMILVTAALLAANQDPDDEAIDAALASQICRCGCYPRIRRAVRRLTASHAPVPASSAPASGIPDDPAAGDPGSDRWGPPLPGEPAYRPVRPWDQTDPAERDWFGALGDGLVVVLPPADPASGWTTSSGGAWLHVSADGAVVAFTGKVDVGQDNSTALRMLVAEELGVPLATVRIAMGDTDLCPFDMGTFGSRSMPDAGLALRQAAAFARALLPVEPGSRRVELVTSKPVLSDATRWRIAGRPQSPPGIAAAVTGARTFASDLNAPGVLHGAVLRPPVPGASLRSLGTTAVTGQPGVLVVQAAGLTGVVAPDPATAARAVAELDAEWEVPYAPSDTQITEYLRAHPVQGAPGGWGGAFQRQEGSPATALEVAAIRCEATYTTAYIAPAALETRVAVAAWDADGRLTVWTGTQTPFPVRAHVAAMLGISEHDVRIIVPPTGGGFGGKHAGGIATEAAVLARAAGKPVRVAWSRAEEFSVGTLRPASVIDITAGLTQAGELSGWTHVNVNAGPAGISIPYRVADQRLEYVPAASPLPQASYRALAATANNFARESMIDELACAAETDPVEFRLAHLTDERLADVLRAVAARVGWGDAGGWGIACGLEKDGRVATAAQVKVGPDRRLRVSRLVTAYECGAIINPGTVRNQVEGAVVMALGGALFERIKFADGKITNGAFSAYRVPRLADVGDVEVILLDRPDLPPAGAGETPMIAVAPAIANAIFVATGRRLRSLPLTEDGLLILRCVVAP